MICAQPLTVPSRFPPSTSRVQRFSRRTSRAQLLLTANEPCQPLLSLESVVAHLRLRISAESEVGFSVRGHTEQLLLFPPMAGTDEVNINESRVGSTFS